MTTKNQDVPSIGEYCGKCQEPFDMKANRFDCGPRGLMFPAETEWDDPSPAQFDDIADTPEMQMHCDDCEVWTTWVFDTQEYLETGGEGWPDPIKVYWVSDEFWAKHGEEAHFVMLFESAS
jgi:hypothetical protein